MTNEEIKPTEKDRETARTVMLRLRRTFTEPSAMLYDSMESDIAQALAEQRKVDAQKCDAIAESLAPLGFGRKVANECASRIRTDPSEGVEKQ